MLLRDWISEKKLTLTEFGHRLGLAMPTLGTGNPTRTVQRWAVGERLPGPDAIDAIARVTDGAVQYEDHRDARRQFAKARADRDEAA